MKPPNTGIQSKPPFMDTLRGRVTVELDSTERREATAPGLDSVLTPHRSKEDVLLAVSVAGASHTPPNLQMGVMLPPQMDEGRGGVMVTSTEEGPLPLLLSKIPALGKADTVVGVRKNANGIAPPCSPLVEGA